MVGWNGGRQCEGGPQPRARVPFTPVASVPLAHQIADRIRQSILDGDLRVGDKLPGEGDLAGQFHVSRPTIREALKRLTAEGLIRSRRGPAGGTFIDAPDVHDSQTALSMATALLVDVGKLEAEDFIEAHHALLRVCVSFALMRASDTDLEQIVTATADLKCAVLQDREFVKRIVAIQHMIVTSTNNSVLEYLSSISIDPFSSTSTLRAAMLADREKLVALHCALAEAMHAREFSAAVVALDEYMELITHSYKLALGWKYVRTLMLQGAR